MSNLAILPVSTPASATLVSPERPGIERLAFDLAAAGVTLGDRAGALALLRTV